MEKKPVYCAHHSQSVHQGEGGEMANLAKLLKTHFERALTEYEAPIIKGKLQMPNIQIDTGTVRCLLNRAYEIACVEHVEEAGNG